MRTETFVRKDGSSGTAFHPENGDVVTAEFDKVAEMEYLGVKKESGKPFKATKYTLGVITQNGEKVYITLTSGQVKNIMRKAPLKGKKIVFETYTHSNFGELLGARVRDEDKKK